MKKDLTHTKFWIENNDVEKIKRWLLRHEQEIAIGADNFKGIRSLFAIVIKREPMEVNML